MQALEKQASQLIDALKPDETSILLRQNVFRFVEKLITDCFSEIPVRLRSHSSVAIVGCTTTKRCWHQALLLYWMILVCAWISHKRTLLNLVCLNVCKCCLLSRLATIQPQYRAQRKHHQWLIAHNMTANKRTDRAD
jgi:hypothetical protein